MIQLKRCGYFCTHIFFMTLSTQDKHNLAMNIVGESLQALGFEFLSVNSKLKKDPQFVALKEKQLHFIIVRTVAYPKNPDKYDARLMQTMKAHADKFEAKTYYAGVGLGSAEDYTKPIIKNKPFSYIYNGLQEIE